MKLWVDDVRPAPPGYVHAYSVNTAIQMIKLWEQQGLKIELIDLDHDAGDYVNDGGDYIKILDWLEENGKNYPVQVHSMNPVGKQKMQQIIEKNNW